MGDGTANRNVTVGKEREVDGGKRREQKIHVQGSANVDIYVADKDRNQNMYRIKLGRGDSMDINIIQLVDEEREGVGGTPCTSGDI